MIRIAMKIILLIDEWIPLNARHSGWKEFYLADTLEHSCFWYIDTFDFSTRNIFHCHGKIMSSLEMKEKRKEWIQEFSISFAPIWRFVYHAISMIHDGRGDIFLSALATQGFWSMKRAFVIEESFILHAT